MTTVFIVDRYELVRRGLVGLIETSPDLRLTGETGDAASAADAVVAAGPDVVVIDVRGGHRGGLRLCAELAGRAASVRCLMLADDSGEDLLLEAIAAGAAGYLLDRASGETVLDGIRAIAAGRSVLDPNLTERLFSHLRQVNQTATGGMSSLTPQERRVLDYVSDGLTNLQIARQCGISEKTVKNHVTSILRKLDISSRTQAALYARKSA